MGEKFGKVGGCRRGWAHRVLWMWEVGVRLGWLPMTQRHLDWVTCESEVVNWPYNPACESRNEKCGPVQVAALQKHILTSAQTGVQWTLRQFLPNERINCCVADKRYQAVDAIQVTPKEHESVCLSSPLPFQFKFRLLPPPLPDPKASDKVMRNKPHDIYYCAQTSRPPSQARLTRYNDLTQSIRN